MSTWLGCRDMYERNPSDIRSPKFFCLRFETRICVGQSLEEISWIPTSRIQSWCPPEYVDGSWSNKLTILKCSVIVGHRRHYPSYVYVQLAPPDTNDGHTDEEPVNKCSCLFISTLSGQPVNHSFSFTLSSFIVQLQVGSFAGWDRRDWSQIDCEG